MEPLGPVIIGAREIYDAVVRLTGRVEVLIEQQTQTAHDVQDHEARLRALERARWPLPTISVLLAILSLGVAVFVAFGGRSG
jgi:hypothetical protein